MKTNPTKGNGESKIFTFVFQNLEVFLLLFTGFLVYSIYNLFTAHVSKHAVFLAEPERLTFASMLIFGLMATEMLLALATSYFRKNNEWVKSFLVTTIAFVIAYFNHLSITEIFLKIGAEEASEAVRLKVVLTNWLIFGLGEIISLLMNSKGNEQAEQAPNWFVNFAHQQSPAPTHYTGLVDTVGNPITAQHEPPRPQAQPLQTTIGFQMKGQTAQEQTANRKPRGKSIDYDRVNDLLDKGLKAKEIARLLNCTEGTVHKIRRETKP